MQEHPSPSAALQSSKMEGAHGGLLWQPALFRHYHDELNCWGVEESMPGCSGAVLRCRELAGASPSFPEKIAAHRSDAAGHGAPSMQRNVSWQAVSDPDGQQGGGPAVKPPSMATSSFGTQTEYRGDWSLSSCQPQAKHSIAQWLKLQQACNWSIAHHHQVN